MTQLISYLEKKIEACNEIGGMEKEKWAFIQCLKEVRNQTSIYSKTDLKAVIEKLIPSEEEICEMVEPYTYADSKYMMYGMEIIIDYIKNKLEATK